MLEDSIKERMKMGNEVGDLAMGLFGDYVDVTVKDGDKLDLPKMIARTQEEMTKGTAVICEASFCYNGLYCAVDILRKNGDGWDIYEVKSSSREDEKEEKKYKQVYIADIAYQKYVLEHCGIKICGVHLVQMNKAYVFDGNLDIHKLFIISDVDEEVALEEQNIAGNLAVAEQVLNSPTEPDYDLSINCKNPYLCGFWNYCSRHLPSPSVFNLYRIHFKSAVKLYKEGCISYEDLDKRSDISSKTQQRQIECYLEDKGTIIEEDNIRNFLGTLTYPLYFLDFESMQTAVPKYIGTHPYAQIPFQYSLHYIENEGGNLEHKEFLAESGTDPRRALAEQLCEDIPMGVTTVVYKKGFEGMILNQLAEAFPDLREHLLAIKEGLRDLLVPFQSGYYYNKDMGGSFSIKNVLPAVFPNDPSLNYHNLSGVQNGGEAMTIFPKIKDMASAERDKARNDLLRYCELDTYAMVKLWQELVRVSGSSSK